MPSVEERVRDIIVDQVGVESSAVVRTANLNNDIGLDSLDSVELIMAFEEEFNLSIPDQEAEKLVTVGQIIDYIEAHQ